MKKKGSKEWKNSGWLGAVRGIIKRENEEHLRCVGEQKMKAVKASWQCKESREKRVKQ